mmetsp:Transcript_13999/g.39611  ORF Transcript_13999/g.39611 Transcript_13999/m.39611 type:complete len:373 (-) Transcript_13999:312-1430(-)|eukprot:CAMPEP_0117659662 /NCGR_PEP_ID=MMETSP0804-20121206/6552_1 /TAXON_ID=1074897 /ORGANISM="Tetraselmis astigmatica, Strain CCMP880" /LENGTH=372 /DNA_ID=CAMNT_0005466335 /DNA_START=188 /DNA_END=1306 /DNA_ORIENTATION=-
MSEPEKPPPKKKYKQYTSEQLEAAVKFCIDSKDEKTPGGARSVAMRRVAKDYGVPSETLRKAVVKAMGGDEAGPSSAENPGGPKAKEGKPKAGGEAARTPGRRMNVLVTGASQGIGLSIALRFLEGGAQVVLVSRNIEKARSSIPPDCFEEQRTNARVRVGRAHLLSKDLSSPAGCRDCAAAAGELLGAKLDVLVNNAGSGTLEKNIHTTTPEDWDDAFNLNLKSYMLMIQASLPFLEASGRGSVVNISGVAAHRPFTSMLPYCCAKAGVEMLSKCCALELASKGIRVNCVAPGTISTDFLSAGLGPEGVKAFLEESTNCHPLGKIGRPRDAAEAVYFLGCHNSSSFITGQSIILDGGRTLSLPSGNALKTS